ncbi:SulP family inorganic anion transporter, partial [Bryobacter aggregatus]|uniref:SulP family inorganic anion transporter n=1 Tax=Bryobacter aggregatus TaxID=360054 RepID=UPI0004E213FA
MSRVLVPPTFGKDFLASFVVFLVALPLCLGVAIASGVPPAMGLITGILGGLVVGSIAGSPLQVSGPAAGLVVLVFQLIQEHGLAALGMILMMAGVLQVGAGLLRTGQWFRAISPAVVYGMLAGIGVLIMVGQFHVVVDDSPKGSGIQNLLSIPSAIFDGIFPINGSVHETAALIGLLTIVVMLGWNRFRPAGLHFLPGPLVGLLAAAGASYFLKLEIRHVAIPDNLIENLKLPNSETLAGIGNWRYWAEAAALAFIASAETLLSAAAVDKMVAASGRRNLRTNYDRELMAQGAGNFLCGVLGSVPMTGVIVRSSANVQAGAQTRWSSVMHGGWLLATVMLVPHWLERIPTSALAAILVLTGWKLVNFDHVRRLVSYGWIPVVIYSATLIGVVAFDLLTGVMLGIGLTFIKMIYKASRVGVKLITHHSGRSDLYLTGSATFLRLPVLADTLDRVAANSELHIHFEDLVYLDHSCLDLLQEWMTAHRDNGGKVVVDWPRLVERFRAREATEG